MKTQNNKQTNGNGKIFEGVVLSAKRTNTATVSVVHEVRHPLYLKAVKRSHKFAVDTQGFDVHSGDRVKIIETKPISKTKHFKINDIVRKAKTV